MPTDFPAVHSTMFSIHPLVSKQNINRQLTLYLLPKLYLYSIGRGLTPPFFHMTGNRPAAILLNTDQKY